MDIRALLTRWKPFSATAANEMSIGDRFDKIIDTSEQDPNKPSWKHRRRLIYIAFFLGVFMILFGLATFWWDRQATSELIIGGVALVSIILSAYTGFAAYEDARVYREPMHNEYEGKSADG